MPQMIKQEDGTEVEVFTAEELETQAKERADAVLAEANEKHEAEKLELESKSLEKDEALADANEKLQKAEAKELNFKALREKNGKGEKEKSEEEKNNAEELKKLQDTVAEIQKQPFEAAKTTFLKNNIGTDKELAEKHEFFFKKLSAGVKTVDEYNIALAGAFSLATEGARQPNMDSGMLRTGVSDNFDGSGARAETQDSQTFGALLGITPEDKKTYGAAIKTGTVPMFAQTPPKESK